MWKYEPNTYVSSGDRGDPVIFQESIFQPRTTGPLPRGGAEPLVALCSLYPFFMTTASSFLHPFHADPLLKREAAPTQRAQLHFGQLKPDGLVRQPLPKL